MQHNVRAECGFVFAATGRKFVTLAEQAAKSLRESTPGFEIDLFSDVEPSEGAHFDRVRRLEKIWFRPKFEAIMQSRFARTVYLDADLVVLANISDIFALLDHFDLAAAHVQNRNQPFALKKWNKDIPASFPQINGGVLGIKSSDKVSELMLACQHAIQSENLSQDQPVLRELLYESQLRLAILPPEYNVRRKAILHSSNSNVAAPRVLHHSDFHKKMKGSEIAPSPESIYGAAVIKHVKDLIAADRTLGGPTHARPVPTMYEVHRYLAFRIARMLEL